MSNRLLDAAWMAALPPLEKLVLVSLACRAGGNSGKCWPSIGDIVQRTGTSERTAQRAIKALEQKGHISIDRRPGTTPMYDIHPRQPDTPTPVTQTPPGVSDRHPTPVTVAPDPRQPDTQTIKNHQEPSAAKRHDAGGNANGGPQAAAEAPGPNDMQAVMDAGDFQKRPTDVGYLAEWFAAGADLNDIVTVVRREAAGLLERGHGPPRTLKIFDRAIREKLADDERQIAYFRKVSRRYMNPDEAYIDHVIADREKKLAWEARKSAPGSNEPGGT